VRTVTTPGPAEPSPRLRGLLLAIFVSSMPGTLILPMLPSLGRQMAVDGVALGALFAIYPLTSVISSPFWGRISDRYGRRPALLGSLAGAAIAFVTFGFAQTYAALFAARALQGLSGSARGIGFAVISDTTEGDSRAAGMGRVSAAMAAAFTLGPVLGAAFMGEHPGPLLTWLRSLVGARSSGFDHLLPSLVAGLLNLGALAIVLVGFEETWRPAGDRKGGGAGTAGDASRRDLFTATVTLFLLQFLMSGLIQGTLQFSFTLWAHRVLQWSAQQLALSLAALGLGFVISSGGLLRPLLRRMPAEHVVLGGAVLDLAGMTLFLFGAEHWTLAITALFISSFGGGLWGTTIVGLLSKNAPRQHQGLLLGIANGIGLVGRVAGPPAAGLMAEHLGPRAPFLAIVICLVAIAVSTLGPALRRRPFETASPPGGA
jgi:DHA1 family tetracycline resistance protein-like MFS transporter